jgi:hypothetical protein
MSATLPVYCPVCDYDLEKSLAHTCPGCGAEFHMSELRSAQRDARRFLRVLTWWSCSLAALFFAVVAARLIVEASGGTRTSLAGLYLFSAAVFLLGVPASGFLAGGMPGAGAGPGLRLQCRLWIGVSILLPLLGLLTVLW